MNSICVGGREEGKSTLCKWLAYQTHDVVIVFDPRGMFAGYIVDSPGELQAALEDCSELVEQGGHPEPIVYRFDYSTPERTFEDMSMVLFPPNFTTGGFALIVDEAGELQGANWINPALKRAVAQHPLQGDTADHILQTSHRLAEYNGKVKTCLDNLYIFRTKNKRDLIALEDFTGEPELIDLVQNLPKHHLIHYTFARQDDGISQYEIWTNPDRWYIPISKQVQSVRYSGDIFAEKSENVFTERKEA